MPQVEEVRLRLVEREDGVMWREDIHRKPPGAAHERACLRDVVEVTAEHLDNTALLPALVLRGEVRRGDRPDEVERLEVGVLRRAVRHVDDDADLVVLRREQRLRDLVDLTVARNTVYSWVTFWMLYSGSPS